MRDTMLRHLYRRIFLLEKEIEQLQETYSYPTQAADGEWPYKLRELNMALLKKDLAKTEETLKIYLAIS